MINLNDTISTLRTSVNNVYDKYTTTDSAVKAIGNSWEGKDQQAFYEAYKNVSSKVKSIYGQYQGLQSRLSSLQSSINAAEQDKERKRQMRNRH